MNNRIKSIDWLATVLYPAFVVLMETFWVYPWLLWLGTLRAFSPQRPALSLAAVFCIMAAAVLTVKYFIRPQWKLRAAQALVLGAGLLVILITIGIEYRAGYTFLSPGWFGYIGGVFAATFSHPGTVVIGAPVAVFLWWRGISLGQSTSYFKSIYNSFILGLAALILLIVLWQSGSSSGLFGKPGANVGLDIIAFFFFGLMAIAVTHLYQMRGAMVSEETGLLSVRRWLPIMLIVIGGMVVIVFLVSGAFSEGFFTAAGQAFSAIGRFFGKLIEYLSIPLNYLFLALIWILRLIINLLSSQQNQKPQSDNGTLKDLFPQTNTADLPQWVGVVAQWLVVVVIVGAVGFFIARAVSRYRDRRALEEIEQTDESLFNWGNVDKDLRAMLAAMARRMQRKKARSERTYNDEQSRIKEIREIYRHLLEEGELSGYERLQYETPGEYSYRLGDVIRSGSESLNSLTELYNSARYGEVLPPVEKVDSANGFWQTLRTLLRKFRGAD